MSALSAVPGRPDETPRRLLSEALRHHRAGELDQAIALYERLLKFVPDLAPAHANLGVALRARGRLEEAEVELERLLRVPSYLSPGWLRIDPTFAALRGRPRFERLVGQRP